jgi:hypothetical protein
MDKSLQKNENAVSPVIGAILMLAIGVTILTTVQLNFIPVWNTQEELDHIQKMFDDFKELKSSIDNTVQSGTTSSLPIIMGFKYSPKFLVYNPKDSAFVSLGVKENTWAEVRYNEMFPDGMTDETSIKNLTTSTITYALMGQKYNSFIYEHGMIRRNGSNYTSSSQVAITNGTIYLISIKPLGPETTSGIEMRTVNIYPTSQQKKSVIGKNVWLILHTKPEYVNWWADIIRKEGGDVQLANNTTGIVIAYINTAVIKMGEAYISTTSQTAPPHAPPYRVVKITPDNTYLSVDGFTTLVAEVQDKYNNPVPNVLVNFSINRSRKPANAYANAQLLQSSGISDVNGKASISLKTSGAGFYYIDAIVNGSWTTFVYAASSQGGVLFLNKDESGLIITATLKDSLGYSQGNRSIIFDTNDGILSPLNTNTNSEGNASTTLNINNAIGISITNIKASNIITNSAVITWDTSNTITVSAQSGYIFNSIKVPTMVNTIGCLQYGTSSGNYSSASCDINGTVSSHSVNLAGLLPFTAYYFKVNSSLGAVNVDSTEYMFVTPPGSNDTTPYTHNYTYVTGYSMTNGTIIDFVNMQSNATGFASITEIGTNISSRYSWSFTPPIINNESWNFSTTSCGTNCVVRAGSNTTDGVPAGSLFAGLSATTNSDRTAITSWRSPNITWTNGTPLKAILNFSFRVTRLTSASTTATSAVFLINPNGVKKQINQSRIYTTQSSWGNFSNYSINVTDFSLNGNYSILLNTTLFTTNNGAIVNISWDNPTITLNQITYRLNMTTDTASVPVDTRYFLEINYSRDAGDTYGVLVLNGTDWNKRADLNAIPGTWNVKSITLNLNEYNGGNPRIRYMDENPGGTYQGNLFIDYQRIHGINP